MVATSRAATTCSRSPNPQAITDIHRGYLEAGADIISTNTFNANSVSMADYDLVDQVRAINMAGVACARKAVDEYREGRSAVRQPSPPAPLPEGEGSLAAPRPKSERSLGPFVAGSIGPTNRTASLSPDVNDPGYRAVNFDRLVATYYEQAEALVDGGVDILLAETVFDTLNLKACLFAIEDLFATAADKAAGDGLGHDHRPQRPHALRPDAGGLSGPRSSMPIC